MPKIPPTPKYFPPIGFHSYETMWAAAREADLPEPDSVPAEPPVPVIPTETKES